MKVWMLRGLVAVVLIGVLFFIGRLALSHWAPIAFWTYACVGLASATVYLSVLGGFYLGSATGKSPNIEHMAFSFMARSEYKSMGRLDRLRTLVTALLTTVVMGAGWIAQYPANMIAVRGFAGSLLQGAAASRIRGAHVACSLVTLGWVAIVAATKPVLDPPGKYSCIFVYALLASVIARLLICTTSTTSLGQKLRLSNGHPYLKFLQIAVCDFLSLVLGFAILKCACESEFIHWSSMLETAQSLASPKEWKQLFLLDAPMSVDWYLNFAGLIYSTAIVSTILQFKDFKRTDSDWIGIATSYSQIGRATESMRLLENVKERNAKYYQTKALSLFALNDVNKALEAMERSMDGSPSQNVGPGTAAVSLIGAAVLCGQARAGILSLLRRIDELNISEGQLLVAVVGLIGSPKLKVSAAEVLKIFDADNEVAERFPLVEIALHLNNNNLQSARDLLDRLQRPMTSSGEMLARMLRLQCTLLDPETSPDEDRAALTSWLDENLPVLKEVGAGLANDIDKTAVAQLLLGVRRVVTLLISDRDEEVSYIAHGIIDRISDVHMRESILFADKATPGADGRIVFSAN